MIKKPQNKKINTNASPVKYHYYRNNNGISCNPKYNDKWTNTFNNIIDVLCLQTSNNIVNVISGSENYKHDFSSPQRCENNEDEWQTQDEKYSVCIGENIEYIYGIY